jgi:hypothetical protein
MITKEKLMTAAVVVLGLAAIYFFTKSFGTIVLMLGSGVGGWYLKSRYGKKVEEVIDNAKK